MVMTLLEKVENETQINVAAFAKLYLEQYLAIRDKRYKTESDGCCTLFWHCEVFQWIDASSVEKMVAKYSKTSSPRNPPQTRHTLKQPFSMMQPNPKFCF